MVVPQFFKLVVDCSSRNPQKLFGSPQNYYWEELHEENNIYETQPEGIVIRDLNLFAYHSVEIW